MKRFGVSLLTILVLAAGCEGAERVARKPAPETGDRVAPPMTAGLGLPTSPAAAAPVPPPAPPSQVATQDSSAEPSQAEGSGGNGGEVTRRECDPSYPDVCIPPPPPDVDCGDISYRRFRVRGADPHRFDGDHDGIGCESG